MNISQLRAALKEKSGQIATLKTAAEADGAADDAIIALRTALDEYAGIEKRIGDMGAAERAIKATAKPSVTDEDEDEGAVGATVKAAPKSKLKPTEKLALAVQSIMHAKHEHGHAGTRTVLKSMEELGYSAPAAEFGAVQKAMASSPAASGGFFMGDGFNRDFIELLWPNSAFLQGSPVEVPMPEGVYRQAGGNAKPTAGYRAEAAAIGQSTPTLRNIDMSAKLLSGLVVLSNQIRRWSLGQADSYVSSSLSSVMGIALDLNTLNGTGAGNAPLGLANIVGITSFAATAGVAPAIATVDSDLRKLLLPFNRFPTLKRNMAFVMEQRVIGHLADKRDGNGNYAYPTMQGDNPSIKGVRVLDSGQLPVNLGAGTNESIIMLVSFGTILHGLSKSLELAMSTEATIGGVNLFETDQSAIRATLEHDVEAQYVESVNKLTAVQWGA